MTDFQHRYKEKPLGFGGVNEGRLVRFERRQQERKQERSRALNRNRNIPDSANISLQNAGSSEPVVEDRLTRLKKWKLEREKKKRAQSRKQKPPFKVGIVHHKIYSPALRDEKLQRIGSSKIHAVPVPKPGNKISKATEKRLKAKALRDATQQTSKQQKKEKSFAPVDHQFKPPIGLPEMPLFGRVAFLPMGDRINNFLLSLSPRKRRSTIRRSNASILTVKDLSFKENKALVEQNPSSENADANKAESSIETVSLKLSSDEQGLFDSRRNCTETKESNDMNSSKTKRRRSKRSFNVNRNKRLNLSISKSPIANNACNGSTDNVLNTLSSKVITKDHKNLKILRRSNARKEQQIRRGLGSSPANDIPKNDTVMQNLNISIEDKEQTVLYFHFLLNKEIERLEEMCNTWEETKTAPDVTEDAQYQIHQAIGQTTLLLKKKFERFRCLVNDCETGKGEMLVTCKDLQGFWDMMYREVRDCDARFEALEKLRARNWIEETPPEVTEIVKKKAVRKKKKAAVTTKQSSIRALIMAARKEKKVSDTDILENATTASSSSETSSATKLGAKSSLSNLRARKETPKKGNTRRSLLKQVQLSETAKTLRSPLTTSKRITLLSLPTVSIRLEGLTPTKESSSRNPESNSPKRNLKSEKENQSFVLNQSLELRNNSNTTRRKLIRQDAFDESSSDGDHENIRVLRNGSISSKTMPNSTRRRRTKVTTSEPNFQEKENKTPLRTKRQSSLKVSVTDSERTGADLVDAMQEISLVENRRRSTRRRVKFTAEDCTGCVQLKPALPMTPHVRRSKSRISGKKMHTALAGDFFTFETQNFEGDLISFDTPDKLPERMRRSRSRK